MIRPLAWRRNLPRAALALGLLSGCVASTQRVALECVPEQVQIYVDGRLLEEPTDELFLRSDEPHKIFVKAPGHQPRLVVLDTVRDAEGEPRLDAESVCLELVPVGQRRELRLEAVEPDVR